MRDKLIDTLEQKEMVLAYIDDELEKDGTYNETSELWKNRVETNAQVKLLRHLLD